MRIFYPLLIFLCMAGWAGLHSWLAALTTKKLARKIFGKSIDRVYRFIFVLIAVLTIIPILIMLVVLPSRVLWVIPAPWVYLTALIQVLAALLLIFIVYRTGVMTFIGIDQFINPEADSEAELVTDGFYGIVRHPLYLFSMILMWLFPFMTDLILAFVIASTLYFWIGTIPEEHKMIEIFGDVYKRYQKTVPRFIPRKKLK